MFFSIYNHDSLILLTLSNPERLLIPIFPLEREIRLEGSLLGGLKLVPDTPMEYEWPPQLRPSYIVTFDTFEGSARIIPPFWKADERLLHPVPPNAATVEPDNEHELVSHGITRILLVDPPEDPPLEPDELGAGEHPVVSFS